jgi:O-antigen/teichoic acid export membrane protein
MGGTSRGRQNIHVHSVKFNVVMNVFLMTSQFLYPLITIPYVSRILSVEHNGAISFAQYTAQVFSVFCVLGIPVYGIRECSRVRDSPSLLAKTVKELLVIISVCTVVTLSVYMLCIYTIQRFIEEKPLLLIFSLSVVLSGFGVEWFFQAIEQYAYITVRSLIFKVIGLAALFTMVRSDSDYMGYAVTIVIATALPNIINIIKLLRTIQWKSSGSLDIRRHIVPVLVFFMTNLATTIYLSADLVILGFVTMGNFQVGLYQLATKIKAFSAQAVNAAGLVMIPRLSYYLVNGDKKSYYRLLTKNISFSLISGLGLMSFIILFAEKVIMVIAGVSFLASAPALKIIAPAIVMIGLSNICGFDILTPNKKEKYMTLATSVGAVTNICLNFLLDGHFGAVGAALSILITELVISVIELRFSLTIFLEALNNVDWLKIVISIAVTSLVSFVCMPFLSWFSPIVNLIMASVLFFGTLLVSLLLVREEFVVEILEPFVRKTILRNRK